MKYIVTIIVSMLLSVASASGQTRSALHLTDGSTLYGTILSWEEDGKKLTMRSSAGVIHRLELRKVQRIENLTAGQYERIIALEEQSRFEKVDKIAEMPSERPRQSPETIPPPATTRSQERVIRETVRPEVKSNPIRTHWTLGMFVPMYSPEMQAPIDRFAAGASHLPIVIDAPGIYLIADDDLLVGTNLNLIFDVYQTGTGSLSYSHLLFTIGTLYFIEDKIGSGFFLRGEAGIAYTGRNSVAELQATHWFGAGVIGGFGYAIPVGSAGALTIGFSTTIRRYSEDTMAGIALSLGWML